MAEENGFGFSTKYRDSETGWYRYTYRYYIPEIGRWNRLDPKWSSSNWYSYISNESLNAVDLLGQVKFKFRVPLVDYIIQVDDKDSKTIVTTPPDTWQEDYGYYDKYDKWALKIGFDIHFEPVLFTYYDPDTKETKNFRIEFWKGRYGLVNTGGEIGIYTGKLTVEKLGVTIESSQENNACAKDYQLPMRFDLVEKKTHKVIVQKDWERTWWLTGFKIPEWIEKDELVMYASLDFKEYQGMAEKFKEGLISLNYMPGEYKERGSIIDVTFDLPKTLLTDGSPQTPR